MDWRGIAVAILAFGITVSLVLTSVSGLIHDEPAPQWLSYLIFTLFGAVIGVVAGYVRGPAESHDKGHTSHELGEE